MTYIQSEGNAMGIIGTIFIGFIVGLLARFLKPGDDSIGWIMTILLGIAGSLAATYGGQALGIYQGWPRCRLPRCVGRCHCAAGDLRPDQKEVIEPTKSSALRRRRGLRCSALVLAEPLHAPSSVDSSSPGLWPGARRRTAGNRLARPDAAVGPKGPRSHARDRPQLPRSPRHLYR